MRHFVRLFAFLLVCGFTVAAAYGQAVATVSGTITDSSGALMTAAQISAKNQGTGLERTGQTDADGHYVIALLPIGRYTVTVTANGFRTMENKDVLLEVNQSLSLDFKLSPATVTTEVNVTAEAPVVEAQRTDASLGQVIHTEQVSELPLNGRDFAQLAFLNTGTVKQERPGNFLNSGGSSEVSFRGSVAVSSQGMRENANDWLYDGVDNNELTAGGVGFLPSIDAISEFKVMTYNFSAQYGSRAGTTVIVSSKSGTNSFHGSVFEFLRNDVLDARNVFDGPTKGKYIQNEYGAALGGPIKKDKTFFFLDFQVNRVRQGLTLINSVPTLLERQGIFTETFADQPTQPTIYNPSSTVTVGGVTTRTPFTGNMIPSGSINGVAKALMAMLPPPNIPNLQSNNFRSNPVKALDDPQWDARLDHALTSNDHIFARFSWDQAQQFLPDGLPGQGSPGAFTSDQTFRTHSRNVAISESHIFAPTLINQFTAGYNRDFNYITSIGYGSNLAAALGIPGANLGPIETSELTQISITGFAGFGDRQFSPFQGGTNVYHYSDVLNWVHGQHSFAFGFTFRAMQENTLGDNALAGNFSFNRLFTAGFKNNALDATTGNAIASFLLGLPTSGGRNDEFNGFIRGRRWKEYRGFADDTWTLNPNLALTLGMAYAVTTPISEAADRFSNMDFRTATIFVPGQNSDSNVGVKTDYSNVEPRLGFAWTPFGKKTWVVRGGYGIYHDIGATGGTTGPYQNPPFASAYSFFSDNITAVRTLSTGFPPNLPPANLATYAGTWHVIDPNFKQGMVQQWNFDVQKELPGGVLLTVAYAGTHGTRLSMKNIDFNTATLGSGNNPANRRTYPQFGQILNTVSDGWVKYNSLQVKMERRATKDLYLLASYTYSKALANGLRQEITGDPGVNYFPLLGNNDVGLASTDLRNNFTLSYLYNIPIGKGRHFMNGLHGVGQAILGGWEYNGITVIHSGFGLGESLSTNNSGTSLGNRPNIVAGCNGVLSSPTVKQWFNTACFTTPTTGTFGNAPRTWLYGPGRVNFDMSLYKNFLVTERFTLQFRSEFFNIFNHPQFSTPATALGSSAFGTITSTVYSSRQIQFAFKVIF